MALRRWTPEEYRQKPRTYDPRLCDIIIDRLYEGETLTEICEDRDMPTPGTFKRWCSTEPNLADAVREAEEVGYSVRHDALLSSVMDEPDTRRGELLLKSLVFTLQTGFPAKYGPRATVNLPQKEDEGGGIDYSREVRDKIEAMAVNARTSAESPGPTTSAVGGGFDPAVGDGQSHAA